MIKHIYHTQNTSLSEQGWDTPNSYLGSYSNPEIPYQKILDGSDANQIMGKNQIIIMDTHTTLKKQK